MKFRRIFVCERCGARITGSEKDTSKDSIMRYPVHVLHKCKDGTTTNAKMHSIQIQTNERRR